MEAVRSRCVAGVKTLSRGQAGCAQGGRANDTAKVFAAGNSTHSGPFRAEVETGNKLFIAGSGGVRHAWGMIRKIAIAGLGSILLGCLPAYAQDVPELDGAPPPLKIPAPQVPKPAPKPAIAKPVPKPTPVVPTPVVTDKGVTAEARLAQQAAAQKAEQVRLEKQAADLKARQASLDARAAELAAEERRLATQRVQQEAEVAAQRAELARDSEDVARQLAQGSARTEQPAPAAARSVEPGQRRYRYDDLDREVALDSCIAASEDAARVQNFYSARYDVEPRFYQGRTLQVRGLMRVEDRRGYRILDTVCDVDAEGDVERFAFLR